MGPSKAERDEESDSPLEPKTQLDLSPERPVSDSALKAVRGNLCGLSHHFRGNLLEQPRDTNSHPGKEGTPGAVGL